MRRAVALVLVTSLSVVGAVLPASAAPEPVPLSAPGWTVASDTITWTAPDPVPLSDAGVEFWEGDRLLGRPVPSADMRTYSLSASGLREPGALQVRSAGRRIDVPPPAPPASLTAPRLPAQLPAADVDPGTPGPFATSTGEYALDPVKLPDYPQPVEMQAVVVAPKDAPGQRPLVLFLHGRHFTCYSQTTPPQARAAWPCPEGFKAVPSHRGYLKAQQLLASQGYMTVSISANGINAQDGRLPDAGAQGRSSLVRTHLARWADWAGAGRSSAPAAVRSAPPADMSKVLLVGHSRGGEGVNRAAMDSLSPPPGDTGFTGPVRWSIKGDVLIGPTIFGHNPVPDVPSVTILPGCDGDVSDLQGQMFVDQTRGVSRGAALHSALYAIGANHNYFNSEWTPGQAEAPANDDFWTQPGAPDPVCSPGSGIRLTADQQQAMGATYTAAAARLFLARDEKVLPLLDGSGVRAPSADPARVLAHAVGGDRTALVVPNASTQASGSARMCAPVSPDPAVVCPVSGRSPHFVSFSGFAEPDRFAVALKWTAGQTAVVRPAQPVSLAGSRSLALRLSVPPNSAATGFGVVVTDRSGQRLELGSVSVTGLPGTDRTTSLWAQEVRVPLPRNVVVAALELVPTSNAGEAWLIDAHGWDDGLPPVVPVRLPRVDAGQLTVDEGNEGTRTVHVPVTVSGTGHRTVRVYVISGRGVSHVTKLVTLQPGEKSIDVPITVTGNTRWSGDERHSVLVQGVRNVVAGAYRGTAVVRNDDPLPSVKVEPLADRVAEGGTLGWRVTLSAPTDASLFLLGNVVALPVELSTTDVPEAWFRRYAAEDPLPSRPLSSTRLNVYFEFEPGVTSMEFQVPTVADAVAEGEEQVRLRFIAFAPGDPELFQVTGTVTDA